jgi:hypothetical protein
MPSFKLLPGNRLSRSVLSNRNDAAEPILPKRESERTRFRSIFVKRDSAFVIAKVNWFWAIRGASYFRDESPWKNVISTAAAPMPEGSKD